MSTDSKKQKNETFVRSQRTSYRFKSWRNEEKDLAIPMERDGRGSDSRTACGLKHMYQGGRFGILNLNSEVAGGFLRVHESILGLGCGFVQGSTSLPDLACRSRKQRWERPKASPIFALRVRLEIDAQTELNPARAGIAVRRNQLGVDHAEVCEVGGVKGRVQERWVIKGIEEVKRKLELRPFVDGGDFPEPHVEVLEPETAQRVVTTG